LTEEDKEGDEDEECENNDVSAYKIITASTLIS
jgi:hypothetical protein